MKNTEYTMLSIPTELLESIGAADGTVIQMYAADGKITIEPVSGEDLDDESTTKIFGGFEEDADCDGYCEFCPFAEECEEGEVD